MIKKEELIKIGQFNKPHALNGEISFTFTDDIFDRSDCDYIVCDIDGIFVPFFIEEYRMRTDTTALIKLVNINSSDEARMFTNLEVFFPKSYIDPEEAMMGGKDYFLGFTINEKHFGNLGKIIEIDDSTANVLFIVQDESVDEPLLIPAADDFVTKIDEENKVIYMTLPDGLIQN